MIHLGTADAIGPGYFIDTAMVLFETGSGAAVVMLQSLILMGVTIWAVARFRLRPGALPFRFVLGNGMIAAALTNDTLLLATYVVMSVVAGIVGDAIVACVRPAPGRVVAFALFGALVPVRWARVGDAVRNRAYVARGKR